MANPLLRVVWVLGGLVLVGIGCVGIVVPGLPSTVFFVGAAWCFSRSSPRLEAWLLGLPGVGSLVRDYRAGLGMPRRAKVVAIGSIALACGLSASVGVDKTWVRVAIVATGLFGIWWIVNRVPTRAETPRDRVRAPVSRAGRVFRIVAFAEAITWIGVLVGAGLSFATDVGGGAVNVFGLLHGVVVIAYVAAALRVGVQERWRLRTWTFAFFAALLPFATVQFERWATDTRQLGNPPATSA